MHYGKYGTIEEIDLIYKCPWFTHTLMRKKK